MIIYLLKHYRLLSFMGLFFCSNELLAQPPGYAYGKQISLQASKVSGTQTNFPVLINITDNDLRTVANGGHVQNANGYDIVFTSGTSCTALLSHEIERYVPATGELVAWVNVPSLSSSANTIIAMYYGNASVSTNPSTTAVWDNNYLGVWHFNNSVTDASSHAITLINASTTNFSGSKIGEGRQLNNTPFVASSSGSCKYLQFGSILSGATSFTFEGWVYLDDNATSWERIFDFGTSTSINMFLCPSIGTNGVKRFALTTTGGAGEQQVSSATTTAIAAWHHFAVSIDNSNNTATLYFDGAVDNSNTGVTLRPSNISPDNLNWFGRSHYAADQCLYGKIDEFRVSNTARSAGRILTSYNNQNNPAAFFTIGAELAAVSLCSVLPVKLESFGGTTEPGGTAVVKWTALQQTGHETFILQRSADGIHWQTVASMPGADGTQSARDYQVQDKLPFVPLCYYRLAIAGAGSALSYSDVIALRTMRGNDDFVISPNPAGDYVKITFARPLPGTHIELLNDAGSRVLEKDSPGEKTVTLATAHLSNGLYYLYVYAGNRTYTRKLVIAR